MSDFIKVDNEAYEEIMARIEKFEKKVLNAVKRTHLLNKHKWLDNEELCKLLHCSKNALQVYRSNGVIPQTYLTANGKRYYNAEEIEEILLKNNIPALPDNPNKTSEI